jgi:hypothetical protein
MALKFSVMLNKTNKMTFFTRFLTVQIRHNNVFEEYATGVCRAKTNAIDAVNQFVLPTVLLALFKMKRYKKPIPR